MLLSKPKGRVNVGKEGLELPQGTLELLILKAVALEPQHGWAIGQRLKQLSADQLHVLQGSLYPALHRLERRGLIKASWDVSDNNRQAKYYELTKAGRKRLAEGTASWRAMTGAVDQVLNVQ